MKGNYNEDNVRELKLYEENNQQLYNSSKMPIWKNLNKKKEKNIYDSDKSVVAFKHHADKSAKAYEKEFGTGQKIFSVADRKKLAEELRDEYEEESQYM